MNKNTLLLLGLLFMTLMVAPVAFARDLVVAVSPYYALDDAKRHSVALLKQLTQLDQGSHVTLIDGYHLSIIGEFIIPDNPAYNNPKARLGLNRDAVAALKRFADKSVMPGGAGHPSVPGAVRLPQLLRYAAHHFAQGKRLDVIVLGSPFYDDPKEPAFSMAGGRFPSDGHLFVSQGKTPFGAADQAGLLKNIVVHVGYGSDSIMQGDRHAYFVKRFWTLYVEALGGRLGSFIADVPTLFRGMSLNAVPAHDFKPIRSDKLEMIPLRPVENKQSIFERPVNKTTLSQKQIIHAENVQIGISWQCALCDLDIYARPLPGADVIYFGRMVTTHGRYWKDYRNSPQPTNGYETISFDIPLDLRTLVIAINFYEGEAPQGVSGEIRISVNDATYAAPFHIPATRGNREQEMAKIIETGKASGNHSVIVDPLHIIRAR